MKKTYLQPATEIVMTMAVRNYMIGASDGAGNTIVDNGGNTSDIVGDVEVDVKGSIFEENPWE